MTLDDIDRMPLDVIEEYLSGGQGDTLTFANEQQLIRYLASQKK